MYNDIEIPFPFEAIYFEEEVELDDCVMVLSDQDKDFIAEEQFHFGSYFSNKDGYRVHPASRSWRPRWDAELEQAEADARMAEWRAEQSQSYFGPDDLDYDYGY